MNIFEFLRNDKQVSRYKNTILIKVTATDEKDNNLQDLQYVYSQYGKDIVPDTVEFLGIYDIKNDIFYVKSSNIARSFITTEEEKIIPIRKLKRSINQQIDNKIMKIVEKELEKDSSSKKLTTFEINFFTSQAINEIVNSFYSDNSKPSSFLLTKIPLNVYDTAKYLVEKDIFLNKKISEYLTSIVDPLSNSKETMLDLLILNAKQRKIIERIKQDILVGKAGTEVKETVDFYYAISKYPAAKSLRNVYRENDKVMVFRAVDPMYIRYYSADISLNIMSDKDADKFKNLFGNKELNLKNIDEVTYGRKTIYQKWKGWKSGSELLPLFCISFLFGSKKVAICYHLSKISQALPHTPPCQRNIELQSPNGFLPPVTKVTVGTYHTSIPAAILKCTPITQKI